MPLVVMPLSRRGAARRGAAGAAVVWCSWATRERVRRGGVRAGRIAEAVHDRAPVLEDVQASWPRTGLRLVGCALHRRSAPRRSHCHRPWAGCPAAHVMSIPTQSRHRRPAGVRIGPGRATDHASFTARTPPVRPAMHPFADAFALPRGLAAVCARRLDRAGAGRRAPAAAASTCTAQSGATVPAVVELYTSEGCSSCPPADRWLSALKGRDGVVALAFHVDYWDSLGWKDRFAQPQFTQRQNATQRTSGARFAYTPQVILDSRDAPNWSSLPPPRCSRKTPATVGADAGARRRRPGADRGARRGRAGDAVGLRRGGRRRPADAGGRRREPRRDAAPGRRRARAAAVEPGRRRSRRRCTSRRAATPEAGATRHWVAVATDGPYGRPVQAVTLACAH